MINDFIKNEYLDKYTNYKVIKTYTDDGSTGTDFERAGFEELLKDINSKKINMVVVKDLSRFGRDHVQTGYYIETFFPENHIRFVSILERYDSLYHQHDDVSLTFIIASNDFQSKQTSVKIRSIINNKQTNGKFIGSQPCFGYMRDPDDKNHLVPNPETSHIVKEIFKLAERGVGVSEITTILNDKGYITPSGYKKTKYSKRLVFRDDWNISSVRKILNNRNYTGDLVQHTQTKASYKSKKKINLDKSLWIVVENTHEPLVSKETFELIQNRKKSNNRICSKASKRPMRLFDGLLYCKECGNRISILYREKKDYWTVNCNRYSRDPKRKRCSPHFFPYNYLEDQIKEHIKCNLTKYLEPLDLNELNQEIVKRNKTLSDNVSSKVKTLEDRKNHLISIMKNLYEDKVNGIISTNSYIDMVNSYELELNDINNEINKVQEDIKEQKSRLNLVPDYSKQIKKLLDLNKPKRELYLSLIDKVEISEDRIISIKYKYGLIPDSEFKYREPTTPRNPYGRKGKSSCNEE